jgi:isopropylmalate/homocitrate/citramalate synthase
VDFAAEDAGRATFDYFVEFLSALDGRVKVFFIADTVGCLTPDSASKIVSYVKEHFRCPIGLHFHNDFGMATANTLSGIMAGADYFSGTFTGIGERSGNAAIEEVVAALKFLHERDIGVKYSMLKEICDAVQAASKVIVQKHKPVIGVNAFAHESGVHVDGILKNARTYEFYDPAEVGNERKIVLGKHSGGSALRHFLHENFSGSGPLPDDFEAIMKNIKILYQKETKGPAGEVFA